MTWRRGRTPSCLPFGGSTFRLMLVDTDLLEEGGGGLLLENAEGVLEGLDLGLALGGALLEGHGLVVALFLQLGEVREDGIELGLGAGAVGLEVVDEVGDAGNLTLLGLGGGALLGQGNLGVLLELGVGGGGAVLIGAALGLHAGEVGERNLEDADDAGGGVGLGLVGAVEDGAT